MAYEERARSSPSHTDPTKKNLNPWQDKSTNNYLGGYHGYQEPPGPPQLDPMLQESLWGNFPDIRQMKEKKCTQEHKVTDDGWSEWPEDWSVEDSDECMSNGFSNGFNNQSSYTQQSQITTSQPRQQNFGQFFDQFATPKQQQQIIQPHKVESVPSNSFFDNVQLNNSTASTPGNTSHLFPQESMATESATVRTGVSYAAVLSGKAEAPEQNNGEFDDINLNENTETGFNEETAFTQPEPALPAASFSPFPAPMPEKMERSAAHLFSNSTARSEKRSATVGGTSHNDLFGSAAEPSLEIDNAFGHEGTSFAQEQQERGDVGHLQESFSHQTTATEEQRQPERPQQESEEATANAFKVHREPSHKNVTPNIGDSFASNQPFSYPTQEKRQSELPLQQTKEATANAFEVHRAPSHENITPNIKDSFASNQPFSHPTQEQRQPELAIQQAEEAGDNAFEVHRQPSNTSVPQSIDDSFASNQPFSYPTQEQRQPELAIQQAEEAGDNALEVHRQPSNTSVPQSIDDSFASNQPFSYPTQEQRQPDLPLQQAEKAADNAFEVQGQPSNTSVPQSIEDSFTSNQPFSYPTQEQRQPDLPLQQAEKAADNAFEVQGQPSNTSVPQSIEDSFTSNQPFYFPRQEQKLPELPQTEKEDDTFGGAHSVTSEKIVNPNVEDIFASHQPFSFPTQEQRQSEMASQESEKVGNTHEDLQPERLQDHQGQTGEQNNQVVPDIEESFDVHQPAVAMEDQRPPLDHLQQPESGDSIQDHFGVESSSCDEHNDQRVSWDDLNQMDLGLDGSSMSASETSLRDSQQDHEVPFDTTSPVPWQQADAVQTTHFSEPSAMVTGNVQSIPMTDVSPDTSESDSSSSSTHDTSSNSDQSQIETAAWREEEVPSYDKYSQPHPLTYMPQASPVTKGKMDDVPRVGIYEQEQSTPAANVLPPPPMMPGNIIADGPRQVASEPFQPASQTTNIASIPGNEFFQHEQQSAPSADAILPPLTGGNVPKSGSYEFFQPGSNMVQTPSVGQVEEDVTKASGQTHFQPGAPPSHMVQPHPVGQVKEDVTKASGQTHFQPGAPPSHMVQPPPIGQVEEDVTKASGQTHFQPGPPPSHMVQPPPIGQVEEDVTKASGQTHFQPGAPPSHMVQPPPVGQVKEDVTKASGQTHFQPGPPPSHMVQPHPVGQVKEDVTKASGQTHFQPGAPPSHMVQPPPIGQVEEDVTQASGQTHFQPGAPPSHMVQPHPIGQVEEDVTKASGQKHFQPGPPPSNVIQTPSMSFGKDVPKVSGAQGYFQPGPPTKTKVKPPLVTGSKAEEVVPAADAKAYFQLGPTSSHMVQPPPMGQPMTRSKAEEVVPAADTKAYFQPGPKSSHMVQPPPMGQPMNESKAEEVVPAAAAEKYFQHGPPPLQMMQPPHGPPPLQMMQPPHAATDRKKDVPKRGGHEYFQPGQQPPSSKQPTADTLENYAPQNQFFKPDQSAPQTSTILTPSMSFGKKEQLNQPPPTNVMSPSVGIGLKKPLHEHSHPAPPVSSTPPVSMLPKASHTQHNPKPAKTSTPEPPVLPESGPMAMTKRPTSREKSRTPVCMSSSLWSTDVPTAMSPSIMLAPALQQSPKPAVPSLASSEAHQPKQDLSGSQELPPDQGLETKDDSLASLSKKERKAEKKRLKALKKEQKKLKQESKSKIESSSTNMTIPSSTVSTPEQVQSSLHKDPGLYDLSTGNPVKKQLAKQESGHHPSEREYHHEKHRRGDELGGGNPHVGDHETTKESVDSPSREVEHHGHVGGNPHRGEHRSSYAEDHAEERRYSRHRNVEDDSQYNYNNPRVRELREESPSRVSQRQSEHLPHQDNTHKQDDRDSYREQYSGSHVLRTSHEDFQERNYKGNEHYDDYRHNMSREYDDHHGPHYGAHEYDDRLDRDHGYTRDRRDAEGYRKNDSYDHYKRGHPRADDYDYYSSRRSREDHPHLDHSFDSQYDRGRPERSSREELDSYRNDYYSYSADRGSFKPIDDAHYGEYKDPHRSNTPSSGSGRSTPGYNYSHDPYYGYQQQQQHYPGYEHHYGYYPGPYGMPYHYPPPPPGYYPGYGPYYDYYHQYAAFGSGHGSQYSSGEGSYHDNQVNEGQQAEESALEKDQEEGEVQEVVPLRTTPLHFLRPHMNCRFGPAGQLLVTLPHHPDDGQKPLVQVSCLKAIFSVKEQEQVEAFPGPLSCRGTMKRQVIEYIQTKADEIQQSATDLASQQARWVLWKFLLSLIKHNGAIVAEDIAEMLMISVQHFETNKATKKTKKKRHESETSSSSDSSSDVDSSSNSSSDSSNDEESSEGENASKPVDHLLVFRALLLEGKTKEALEYAMNNNLWAHAVLLGGLMDTKTNSSMLDSKNSSSIISRFFTTLEEKDPLKTVYEHLGGKVPHAVKHHSNWASNLAGIIANPTPFPEKDKENIITLGDTLAKHPDLVLASHLCYLLAGLRPGTPGTNAKMVLIGCEHRSKRYDKFESLEALQLTELFEYASSLENSEFFLPGLQMFRYFYATKLVDAGYHKEALDYLQCVGDLMMKHPQSFNETMKKNVYKTTDQLVGHMEQSGKNVELFVQSWLKKFNNVMEGKDSGISLPQQESGIDEEEDAMAQSSMSYFSGYEHPPTQNENASPESTSYTHNTVSRQASIQSTHSVPSVHSLQTLDLSQPVPSDIYQPNETIEHKESFSSQGYQDQNDGQVGQEYQQTESVDPWQQQQQQQQQQQFGNDMWMPGAVQQNTWMPPASVEETGRETSPEDGETTPVNASHSFEDFYQQANPMTNRGSNWEDNSATPSLSPSDSSLPSKDTSEPTSKEEKNDSKVADKSKPAQSSGFWTGITGLVKTFIPKGPKEVHLPDDKNKTIYFDKELNKWINTEEKDEDKAPPPPPPTDAMIGGMSGPPSFGPRPGGNPMNGAPQGMIPPNHPSMPTPGSMNTQAESVPDNSRVGPGSPGGPGSSANNQDSLPGMLPGMQTTGKPAGPPSKFSRKAQGRLGSRNKYVDVLNPNKGSQSSSQAVPSALFPVMPTGGGSFQGTFFVPSAAPADNDTDDSLSQPPTNIQSGQTNPQPPSPTHSRSSSLGSQSTVSLASAEVRSYFEGQEQEGGQLQKAPLQQPTFFDPSNFQPQQQSPSMARRGRGRYPGGYNK